MIPNLSKEMIDLLQQLRKRLRSEFGVDLKLSQVDVINAILVLVDKSKDQKTQLLFADLEDMMGLELRAITKAEEPAVTTSNRSVQMYRGQVVQQTSTKHIADQAITSRTKVYRGQVVA